jgi:hypothetical protein
MLHCSILTPIHSSSSLPRPRLSHGYPTVIKAAFVTCDTTNNGNREKTYRNMKWMAALQREVGGFAVPRAFEGTNVIGEHR